VKALTRMGHSQGLDMRMLHAVEDVNDAQKRVLAEKVVRRFGEDLSGKRFAIWGLAFKPNTDDMREAPSLVVIDELVKRGATVCCYDPVAMDRAKEVLAGKAGIEFAPLAPDALEGADALLILTEWKEFKSPDVEAFKSKLRAPIVFDGRNLYEPSLMKTMGVEYHCIGRPSVQPALQ
jgi:UDPglucose 6-dehydrogenase